MPCLPVSGIFYAAIQNRIISAKPVAPVPTIPYLRRQRSSDAHGVMRVFISNIGIVFSGKSYLLCKTECIDFGSSMSTRQIK